MRRLRPRSGMVSFVREGSVPLPDVASEPQQLSLFAAGYRDSLGLLVDDAEGRSSVPAGAGAACADGVGS